ncbi:hypothetical protein Pyn_02136 [Prunus yedoensis var. nudiflora]|uniref:ABC-type xenobiotic transporter n=1 Tax=Prunus yedoensis var. nudiflora TaxID=2094558 RepID=A0A314Z131_PRUYE|nr:hypothetical protein Pyn_02136 [Prunus yedoensis var. nudiflora]
MDDFMNLICPNSPSVWDGNRLSKCFGNIYPLEFVTIVMIAVLGINQRTGKRSRRMNFLEKFFFVILPAIGACISFVDIALLLKKAHHGVFIAHHEWFFRFSQFASWTLIILFSKFSMVATFFATGSCVSGGLIKQASYKRSSLEDSLLSADTDVEEGCLNESGDTQSYFDLMTFRSITSVMNHGVTKQLDFEDLLQLPIDMDPCSCHDTLLSCWQSQQSSCPDPSLFRAICCAYGWPYIRLGLLKVLNDCVGFAAPLLLNKLIHFLQQGSESWDGYVLAISLGLVSIFKSFLDTQYSFHLSRLKLKLRSSIITVIYQKCLYINLAERSKFTEGEIQTFMAIDSDRTVNLCNSFHDMWSLPFQIGVALFLLYTQVKFAFVAGIAITISLIPVNKWISTLIASATVKMMKQKDERIRRTGELLTYIRTLKMHGWELLFSSWLMETRSLEVMHLTTRKYLDAWCVFFWATTPTLFSLFTFGLFTLMGHQLDAATVFTCLALFNTLISPLNSFPWVINGLIDAVISIKRLSRFLSCSQHKSKLETTAGSSSPYFSTDKSEIFHEDKAVVFDDSCCAWSSSDEKDLDLVLKHVTLGIPKGSFVAVIGEVPWIQSGTIRDNILFGKHYDPKRYLDTLEASALDLDISLMVGGDMAYIGEKGINLSGGQRARIALARAMYNGSDMFILDDVLSAVDAHCSAISSADTIVVMDKGHVKWVGRSADWPPRMNAVEDIHVERQQNLVLEKDTVAASDRTQEIIEVEARKEGRVELTIYKKYATFSGWFISVVICLSAILMQASRNGNDLWLSNWVDATRSSWKEYSTSFYLVILCIFCIVNSILTLVRAFSFAFGGLRAAVKVHDTLLKRLINAPVQFFDQTPGGRILNRFSSDLYTIDDSLPFILNILLANFVGLLGIAIVLSYVQVLFLLLLLPFWYIYSKLQFFYRSTSRELRRLDSVSRSPIYTSFTETLDGSSTIRAFKSEDLFFARFTEQVKLYQQTSYTELTASLWLSLRLQLLAAFIISFVAVMAVIGSHGRLPINFSTPGLVGLALSYAAPVVSLLGSFLTSFTETEKEMVSVERALEYMDVPQEELHGSQPLHPSWPYQGQIEFQNVTLRYKPSLPAALRDISFTIEGGMQVGFIGRTGAGKSSVLNALFRLTPICKGCILVDSINIASAPIRDLRGHFSVVPQTPFLFEGSLRDNLDPFLLSDDFKIWKALERCHVKEEVEAAGGLDIHLKESGMSFSVGQRQLLCLARALLKSSKVLCLDECTANVDTQTASIIQKTISSECRGMTVITIAHRISTVLNMDSVLVLDHGILVEQGNPQALLENESSRFSSFCKASTM